METAAGLYTLHFNEAANEDVYCVVKTDIETATQEKVASITLDGGFYGMAVWDDAVDLYLQENTAEDERPSLRYTIDTATGGVEKQQMDGAFAPTWYDDAALYQENRSNLWVESLTRLDRTTGELTLQNLPGQTYTVCGAVDGRWLLVRVSSRLLCQIRSARRTLSTPPGRTPRRKLSCTSPPAVRWKNFTNVPR